jgi:GTP-binding protein HflX
MKKLLLLLLFMFAGLNVFGQALTQNFVNATFPPTGWTTFETGTGFVQSWSETTSAAFTFGGVGKSALIVRENVGKSTLMNAIGKSEVFVENKLFGTLDTTVRKTVIKNLPFLLSDTVGFIRKLPTQLVDSFKSTLDEVREADLLLHVVDISHPEFEDHIAAVNKILLDIKSADKPTIMVFNKIDAYKYVKIDENDETVEKTTKNFSLQDWERTWMSNLGENNTLFISATEKENFETFREKIYNAVREIHISRFPYNKFLYPDYKDVIEEEED